MHTQKVTLDHNCLVNVEQDNEIGMQILQIASDARYTCHIVDIGSSEMKKGRITPDRYALFEELLQEIGLDHLPRLTPMGIYDFTFWNKCKLGTDEMVQLAERITAVLWPNLSAEDAVDDSNKARALRNRLCDIHGMWAHIHYGNDIFCTSDGRFHTRKAALIKLGAKSIQEPAELYQAIQER